MNGTRYWSTILARPDDSIQNTQREFCPLLLPPQTLEERIRCAFSGSSSADVDTVLNSISSAYRDDLNTEEEGWRRVALAEALSVAGGYDDESLARLGEITRSSALPSIDGHIWIVVAYCHRPRALRRLVDSLLDEIRRCGRN